MKAQEWAISIALVVPEEYRTLMELTCTVAVITLV
jgi:hypothetical protein